MEPLQLFRMLGVIQGNVSTVRSSVNSFGKIEVAVEGALALVHHRLAQLDNRNPAASYPKREIYTRRYNIFHLARISSPRL